MRHIVISAVFSFVFSASPGLLAGRGRGRRRAQPPVPPPGHQRAAHAAVAPSVRVGGRLGKGQMGSSALVGSLLILCFLTEGLLGTPVNMHLYSQKCQGVPFSPNLSKFTTFAAATLVSTPFVPNQPTDAQNVQQSGKPAFPASVRDASASSGASACDLGETRMRREKKQRKVPKQETLISGSPH